MTLSSAYIEVFIRGEKSGGKCPDTTTNTHTVVCITLTEGVVSRFLFRGVATALPDLCVWEPLAGSSSSTDLPL